ncbi:hypothetical protein PQR14_36075 [Paraburkholderia bryophila]|uniref:hypothetical protein n=1 Tax=Paraburkholderia bryophila TaxID=420952 RepID=UPI0038B80A1D
MTLPYLRSLIGDSAFSAISELVATDDERHPAWSTIYYAGDGRGQSPDRERVSLCVEKALRSIFSHDKAWLSPTLIQRLSSENFSEAASALGEIRAYAALIDAFGKKISGIPTEAAATPDFAIRNREDLIYVEVATKRMNEGMVQKATVEYHVAREKAVEAAAAAREEGRTQSVSIHGYNVEPHGVSDPSKTDDHPVSNAISKLCAVKQNAHQFTRGHPTILWIDLQDAAFWPHNSSHAAPVLTEAPGSVVSGSFWYALYGEKGLPMFFQDSFMRPASPGKMAHSGKFLSPKGASLSAVVLSLPHATIVFENPGAMHPLPRWFRWFLLDLPVFDAEHSMVNWSQDGALTEQIASQKRRIITLHDEMLKARSTECPW